jgi:uncharacterized protein (DUF58 family)
MKTRLLTRWVWPARFTAPPLIDDATLQRIYLAANSKMAPALLAQREVQHILLGERQSTYAGRGYEFAENRAFMPGDEARFINWRVLARSGQLYRKTFYEERRPPLWLLLDRGASMRFGTRTRLKVALAAQLALFHLFLAQRSSLLTGGVLLDDQPSWFMPTQDRGSQQALIRQICTACPPLPENERSGDLKTILQQCQVQLAPGCILILYSDFNDLQANDMQLLHALAQQHTVYARHIIDISEQSLPTHGELHFVQGDDTTALNCNDAVLTQRFQQHMQQRHTMLAEWFREAGIEYQMHRADDDLFKPT